MKNCRFLGIYPLLNMKIPNYLGFPFLEELGVDFDKLRSKLGLDPMIDQVAVFESDGKYKFGAYPMDSECRVVDLEEIKKDSQ